ncbi:hypothetical protein Golob_007789 [Gossypium lobatum]|uniref:Spindle and kinetochore-associated protein 1 homolog n=2 Tax=Gossypium TaxID=3633 RepID=A0A7J8XMZ4_GOSAI|nr:hypothetical protein [Gossypium lobatum]MBA0688643.1 hypothetical protein [Gossypium aridum]
MDLKQAGSSLDSLISSFNTRIAELQELVIARNMYPASSVTDLSAIDAALKGMELQVKAIKDRLHEETEAIPKAKKLIAKSLRQQKKLQSLSVYAPSYLPERTATLNLDSDRGLVPEACKQQPKQSTMVEEPAAIPKEKKSRGSPPLWYITTGELDSLSSYMRGRLTLEKVNAAINDMATYAEANAQLIAAPKKKVFISKLCGVYLCVYNLMVSANNFPFMKLAENQWERSLELRDIATTESIKGKHFFLETDMKGPSLKLDNTGKAILTVLRHLGRISETRMGHHRVIILLKPQ